MRGTFFVQGVEIVLNVEGEKWHQGETLKTSVSLKAHNDGVDLTGWSLCLVQADQRKVKKKDPKAFELIEEVSLAQVDSSGANSLEHTFNLSNDCLISDGTWTLALLIGPRPLEAPYQASFLNLTVMPWRPVSSILELFENFQRFKLKSLKNKKNKLEAKMIAPGSKELGAVEGLDLLIERLNDGLGLNFSFKVKKLAYGAEGVKAKAEKVSIKKELSGKNLLSFGDSLNQDQILKTFSEVIEEVKTNSMV
jgi:hypothetical protein